MKRKQKNANIGLVKIEDDVDGDAKRAIQMEKFVNVKACQSFESGNQGEERRRKEEFVVFLTKRNFTLLR